MEIQKISLEDFNIKSHSRTATAFNEEYQNEVLKAITDNADSCIVIDSVENAMNNYSGNGNAKPSKITATFFIQMIKKAGYKDASKNRVSISNGYVNLRL